MILYTILFFFFLASDIISKYIIKTNFTEGDSISIINHFFKITYVKNEGIAFGMFQNSGKIFMFLTPIAILILGYIFYKFENKTKLIKSAFLLIFSGATGNYLDRIFYGYVVDFFDFDFFDIFVKPFSLFNIKFYGYSLTRWPAFNIADSLISIGVVLLIIDSLLSKKEVSINKEKDIVSNTI